jgi:Domain of unknown function (DUF4331)
MNANLPKRLGFLAAAMLPLYAVASSHREAPAIAGQPRVDGTDFYMFRSYEPGRSAYVTFIANYIPLQDAYGGPNYFNLDPKAAYQIHVDNDGDGLSDLRFEFSFTNTFKDLAVNAGGDKIPVPLINIGPVDIAGTNLNLIQSYTITLSRHGRRESVGNATLGGAKFFKPTDNIGNKSIADYAGYAAHFVYDVSIPDCPLPGRVFVGQRKDGFVANLGEIFDLLNLNPAGQRDAEPNTLTDKNVTSITLEVPISCLTHGKDPVIGAWTTASLPREGGADRDWDHDQDRDGERWQQVSRLGMPLVNELVIGLPDKDKFNASRPIDDAQFLKYVTNPSLPVLLNALFGNAAMIPGTPRNDLVAAFLTGVKGINQPIKVRPGEMLRLNTSIAPTPVASQNDLGVLGGDLAGFPNGRRPYDDVVDITLRVAEGALCGAIGNCGTQTSDPNHGIPYTDGARAAGPDLAHVHVSGAINAADTYSADFPYLLTPIPGSPNGVNGEGKGK